MELASCYAVWKLGPKGCVGSMQIAVGFTLPSAASLPAGKLLLMMTLVLAVGYLLAYPLALVASWVLLISLHEGGHALAALLLMPGEVQVYIGSYHQPEGSYHCQLGRLHLFVKRNLLHWRGGCCYASEAAAASRWQYVLFVLAGPATPLVVASLGFYLSMHYENGMHRLFLLVFLFVAIVSALKNIFPSYNTLRTPNGQLLAADGFLLRHFFPRPSLGGPSRPLPVSRQASTPKALSCM